MIIKFISFLFESLLHPKENESTRAQALRQILSGAIATFIDLLTFQISLWAALSIFTAACNAFLAGTSANYIISRYYVYGQVGRQKLSKKKQLPLYFATAVVSLIIMQAGLWFFAVKLGILPIAAKIIMVPIVYIWSFASSKFFVFRVGK